MLPWLVVLSLLALAAVLVAVGRGSATAARGAAAVLRLQGPARCLAALDLLRRLVDRGDEAAIARVWERLELPLVEALPDCPPDAKPALVAVCDDLARVCSNRSLAKRVMTVRNSLLPR